MTSITNTEAELLRRNNELTELNARLSMAQEQLMQSEKLASIGQLAAGVAHEINNPIDYVSSNLQTLSGYVSELTGLLDALAGSPELQAQARKHRLPDQLAGLDRGHTMNETRIMLVDDDPLVLSALTRLLRGGLGIAPLQIDLCADGAQALRRLDEHPYALVVADYHMPGMDGVALLRAVAAGQPDAYRVLLTGNPSLAAVLQAVNEAEVSRVVLKPWQNEALLLALRGGLDTRAQRLADRALADAARLRQGTLTPQEAEQRRLESLWPGITKVDWAQDGAVEFAGTGLIDLDPLPE